jgi:hypothetical protein
VINSAVSNADDPGLSIGILLKQSVSSRQNLIIDFKGSSFDVDCNNFALVSCFDLMANGGVIEFLSTLGQLFFAITPLAN